ncbi:MAG: LysM peptidoglycan-binding domain-containing protein, partial [Candidatus Zixiibacteriota bacterium]
MLACVAGCGGKSAVSQPQLYGDRTGDKDREQTKERGNEDDTSSQCPLRYNPQHWGDMSDSSGRRAESGSSGSHDLLLGDPSATLDDGWLLNGYTSGNTDLADSAAAVDDDIWRKFELAEEYHAMGVIANREAAWEEAQYYFENALKVMATLDIEPDSLPMPETEKYGTILDNIIADYRVALRSLGHLDEDVSASVLIERFGDIAENLDDDTICIYRQETPPVTYDLPIVMNERVRASIVYFQTVARDAFVKYLSRSRKYAPMMKQILPEYGLPQDLVYLSLVESGYNPRAYSWARAVGLWQFISSTGRLYGLNRTWWVDERRDPVKSTHAACRFLKDLYNEFGSWELAMAAYNGGPARVRKTIERQKTIDFWKMRLKRQTMDYVPLIMAATIIAKEPEKYGFGDVVYEPVLEWDEVVIDRCLDLPVVAGEIGCSLQELCDLNPELLRRYTPPNVKKYTLKVPKGTQARFLAAYETMPSPKETSWVRHKIRRGETVSTIAARYGVSQYAILEANDLRRNSLIYAGRELIVPVPLDRDYDSGKGKREYSAKNSIYTVRAGDTMWDIARAFGTTVSGLRRINYIEHGSRIYVGQKLKIPAGASKLASKNIVDTRSSSTAYAAAQSESKSSKSKESGLPTKKYKVRRGDTLWDIARQYGTTTANLRRLNDLGRSSRIYPGQILVVSGADGPDFVMHTVRRGETLSRIARKYRTSIAGIMAANG